MRILTAAERAEIQAIANKYNTSIEVVGSRAEGRGRNIGSNLPVGKGLETRSDIDFRINLEHPKVDQVIRDLKRWEMVPGVLVRSGAQITARLVHDSVDSLQRTGDGS